MKLKKQQVLILALIGLGLLIVGFFGMRSLRAVRELHEVHPAPLLFSETQSAESDVELIRDWMTIGYISHTYRLPPRLLYEALGIRPEGNEEKSLEQLNEEYFPDQHGYVLETVKATIAANLSSPSGSPPRP